MRNSEISKNNEITENAPYHSVTYREFKDTTVPTMPPKFLKCTENFCNATSLVVSYLQF